MKVMRPKTSGEEAFRVLLESTSSPFVYQDQLKAKVAKEVGDARSRAEAYLQHSEGLEKRLEVAAKEVAGFAKLAAMYGRAEDEAQHSATAIAAKKLRLEHGQLGQAANEWETFADVIEAELATFMQRLVAAQAAVAAEAQAPQA